MAEATAKKKRVRKTDENGNPVAAPKRDAYLVYTKGEIAPEGEIVDAAIVTVTRNAKEAMSLLGKSNGTLAVVTIQV